MKPAKDMIGKEKKAKKRSTKNVKGISKQAVQSFHTGKKSFWLNSTGGRIN